MELSDRYVKENGRIYLSGLQSLVRLPLDVARYDRRNGRSVAAMISGYEGSPLAGYDLELMRQEKLLAEQNIVFKPGVNEELAANIVQGSQLAANSTDLKVDGVTGYWYGKAPGLDRASDALRHANLGGASATGGAVAIVGDDSLAKSSTVPSSSEIAMAELGMPVLVPANPGECISLGMHSVMLSRFSGLWTGLKIATNVADGSATVEISESSFNPIIPDNVIDGKPFSHRVTANFLQPTLSQLEKTLYNERIELARRYIEANKLNQVFGASPDARVGIVAAGPTYLDVVEALLSLGIDESRLDELGIKILKLGAVHPLCPSEILSFAIGLEEIIVVEEKRSFIESGIKEILYGHPDSPAVSGKQTLAGVPLFRRDADLTPEVIAKGMAARLSDHCFLPAEYSVVEEPKPAPVRRNLPLLTATRTPYFCSGCPHNRSTQVPEGSMVGAGIGCSGMVAMMPENRVGNVVGLTQMGGEGAPWIGMSPFVSSEHYFQNMGDGTFHHSGSLAIRAAVAANANITFKLLYNSAVAMTGGQDAIGGMEIPQIVKELLAEGVTQIVITTNDLYKYPQRKLDRRVTARPRDDLFDVQNELSKVKGVTVLIHDQECATELRRKRKRGIIPTPTKRAFINQRVCEGCGDCGDKSNCLSVQPVSTELGRKTKIHQASCNLDYSCLDGDCPSFLTVTPSGDRQKVSVADLSESDLVSPVLPELSQGFGVRITGIGGTGIVTVAQVISTAAQIDGNYVVALDQTGLAQKGGAVVSDVRLSANNQDRTNKIPAGQADLYLGCDLLVAAQENYLSVANPDRTTAIISTAEVPTGTMVTDTTAAFPSAESTIGRIQQATKQDGSRYLDARELTLELFDDDQYANVFLMGVAFQSGALPVRAESLEEALRLNGVAVDKNIQAFRRGRQFVSNQRAMLDAISRKSTKQNDELVPTSARLSELLKGYELSKHEGLAERVESRAADLEAYQNLQYAQKYLDILEGVLRKEQNANPGSTELTFTVAQFLHKLMAYKDEYEVARLSIDPALEASLKAEFGPGYKASYRLHPPILRAMGMKKKLSLGPWFRPIFVILYKLRWIRGTKLDIFGYHEVRRTERELISEYVNTVEALLAELNPQNQEAAVSIAALPDLIRGYEDIKLKNVALYRDRVKEEMTNLNQPQFASNKEGA